MIFLFFNLEASCWFPNGTAPKLEGSATKKILVSSGMHEGAGRGGLSPCLFNCKCGMYYFLYNMSLLSFYKVYKKLNIFPPTLPPAEKINN